MLQQLLGLVSTFESIGIFRNLLSVPSIAQNLRGHPRYRLMNAHYAIGALHAIIYTTCVHRHALDSSYWLNVRAW